MFDFAKRLSVFIWNYVRIIGRVKFLRGLFYLLFNLIYENRVVTIPMGAGKGLKWIHLKCAQPWMAVGLYEPETAEAIISRLSSNSVFFDIGANVGYYTIIAARIVSPKGLVVAFEPIPDLALLIKRQINVNGFSDRCIVERLAVNDRSGTCKIVVPSMKANAYLSEYYSSSFKVNR